MAKDPAFLFYSSDFLTGTMFMTNEQVGLYLRMLCAQHQHGGRIDTNVLRTQCESITNGMLVYSKFKHDEHGSYNERLQIEMDKRKAKSVKAAESVKSRWNKAKSNDIYERNTNVIRSENENENENEDENVIKVVSAKFKKPEPIDVLNYMAELNQRAGNKWQQSKVVLEAQKFFDFYTSNGWKVGRNSMKDWQATARNWMNNNKPTKTNINEQRVNEVEYRRANDPNYFKL
jgi:uncharacterized protein YdaU (DUF1376 family)